MRKPDILYAGIFLFMQRIKVSHGYFDKLSTQIYTDEEIAFQSVKICVIRGNSKTTQ